MVMTTRIHVNGVDRFVVLNLVLLAAMSVAVYTRRQPEYLYYVGVFVAFALIGWHALREYHYPLWLLAALETGILAHFAGGLLSVAGGRLYEYTLPAGVGYDDLVHFYNSAVILLIVREVLHQADARIGRYEWLLLILGVLGIGAAWEVIEFVAWRIIPSTLIGDYANNMTDLLANGLGGGTGVLVGRLMDVGHRATPTR
jgi:hypothetical protein